MPELPALERIKTLDEVETGFTEEQMKNEASRCLECGCSAFFDCDLRKYATDFEVDLGRFMGDVRMHKVDKDHPFITLDPNKCINCGRCVRTCSEFLKIAALGFVYRGFKSVVKPSMEKKLLQTNCISCGNCIAACPTGAITEKVPFTKPGPWTFEDHHSICSFCSVGCNLNYRVYRGQDDVFSISTVDETFHNKGFLCVKGRFGYRYMLEPERLTKPMIKKKGQHQEVTWEEAFDFAAKKLKGIIDKDGAEAVAAFGSPRMTNEELYLLQKFVRAGLKTDNIGSFTNLINGVEQNALDDMFGITTSTTTLDDLKKADVIMVLNADMQEQNLVAEMRVKHAQKEAGVKLITVSSSELELNKFADLSIDSKRGTNTALLNGMAKMFIDKGLANKDFIGKRTEGFEGFAASLANFDVDRVSGITGVGKDKLEHLSALLSQPDLNLIVVYNIDALWEKSRNDLKAIGNLMMLNGKIGQPGNGIVVLRDFSNAQGILDMGVDPAYLPGNVKVGDSKGAAKLAKLWGTELTLKPVDLKAQLENDQVKGLIIFGEDPLRTTSNLRLTGGAEFTLVVDSFMTPTAIEADVVLPAALPVETKGSYTACDRRVQSFDRVFSPKTGMDNWQIIAKLAEKLGVNLGVTSVEDISNEINKANAYYSKAKPFWGNGLFAEKFPTSSGKGKFAVLPLDVSPLSLDKKAYLASEQFIETKIKGRLSL